MSEPKRDSSGTAAPEIEVTKCPDCGTEWERVETHRRDARKAETTVQW